MLDVKQLKVIRKKEAKVQDPVRYPDVILGYEKEFKDSYMKSINNMNKGLATAIMLNVRSK